MWVPFPMGEGGFRPPLADAENWHDAQLSFSTHLVQREELVQQVSHLIDNSGPFWQTFELFDFSQLENLILGTKVEILAIEFSLNETYYSIKSFLNIKF